ncbi:MAG: HD domain-containing protein [Monoglobales bacterium]
MIPTKEEAWKLLCDYNKEAFHLKHSQIVADVMKWYADKLSYADEADFWWIVGLLHDLDFEQFPEEHCIKVQEILYEKNIDPRIVHAVASHGYLLTVDIRPEHEMEKVLYAIDELTGLIGAVVKMIPTKNVQDLEVKTVKKKFKDKSFAARCSREVILRGAEMLGYEIDYLIEQTILAMRESKAVNE